MARHTPSGSLPSLARDVKSDRSAARGGFSMTDTHIDPRTGEILDPPATHRGNGKSKIRADETKRQKFVRLVDPRMNKALEAIRRIAKLGGTNASHYEFGDDDIGKIIEALAKEVAALEKTLERGKPEKPAFSILDD
jgi:hypothetical protein